MADTHVMFSGRNIPPGPSQDTSLRGLANDLRDASDSAVLRVTRVVDGLAIRGDTDRLLEGLRPRLAALRPLRPPALGRVLFGLLDPLIVADKVWRAGAPSIPRSLLAPVLAVIRQHLADCSNIEEALAAGAEPDPRLWLQAAAILAECPMPAATGLPPQVLKPLLGVIRLVFSRAETFRSHAQTGQAAPDQTGPDQAGPEMIRPLLLEAARTGPLAWSIVLALLFEHSMAPAALVEDVLAMARETAFARHLERGLQTALSAVIERLDNAPENCAPPGPATDKALLRQARYAARLAGFRALPGRLLAGSHLAERNLAERLAERAMQVAMVCSAQLLEGLRAAPSDCLPSNPMTPQEEAEAAERLETRLSTLRRLDLAARPLGHAEDRETVLADAAAFYAGNPSPGPADPAAPGWLTQADRLRLCEILVGAEAALRLVNPEPSGSPSA